jgi:MFS family permease
MDKGGSPSIIVAEAMADAGRGRIAGGMGRAWAVVMLCFFMQFISSGPVYYAYGNYAVAFAQEFSAPRAVINIGFTMLGVFGNLGSVPVGMAADRWPIRWVAAFGVVGTALGFLLASRATAIWQIIVLYSTLIALADICIGNVVSNYLISHWFERRRGLALGLSVLGASAAGVVFPPLTDHLIGSLGWRQTFVVYAGMALILLPGVWVLAKLPKQMPPRERRSAGLQPAPGPVITLRELMRSSQFWTISLAVATMIGANTGTMVSLVGFAKASGLSTAQGSYMLSLLALCAMIGKVGLGAASDRLSHRTALQIGIGSQICGMVVLASTASYPPMLVGAGLFGLGLGAMMPIWGAAIAAIFGLASYGRVLGWSRAVMTPVSMLFPIAAAWIFDQTGSFTWAWSLFATLLALALVGTLSLKSARHPAAPSMPAPEISA